MELFTKCGVLTPSQSKTNIRFDFEVPGGVKALRVEYKYSPKYVENKEKSVEMISLAAKKYGEEIKSFDDFLPLSNLVTLSFDDCNGYRGACHRHPNEQSIYISSEASTPGIINSPITQGMWSVTLNVHFVGSDEVEYSIKIEGE